MIIQNEYCNGGSLGQAVASQRNQGTACTERQARTILLHVAKGLKYIHSMHMVHLDVKPDNIFISSDGDRHNTSITQRSSFSSVDDGFEDDTPAANNTYKIGDLGHVTSVLDPAVEEGDCRYLAPEMLQDDYSDLPRVDIFALGLTIYEAATGRNLPRNGEEWHSIRNGNLPDIPGYSEEIQDLIKRMIHADPSQRPTASELVDHKIFQEDPSAGAVAAADSTTPTRPETDRASLRLQRELEESNQKNQELEAQLEKAKYYMQHLIPCSNTFVFTSPIQCNNKNNNNNAPISITPMLTDFNNFLVSLEDKSKTENPQSCHNDCASPNMFKITSNKGRSPRPKHYTTRQQKKRRAGDNGNTVKYNQLIGKKEVRSQSIY